ncbi:MAG: hypothetical protein H0V18_00200, partial [Pyrinomonadaceae bacterium]|nr:hypothetical protein [Pyrinomonadaceae bacterium]
MDLAIAAGRELVIIQGRDRQLLLDPEMRASVQPAMREQRAFPVAINSLVLGDFKAKQQTEIALLFDDGALQLLSRGTASKAKQVAEQSIALWQSEELPGGDWAATMLLGSAKLSSRPGDELLAVDERSGRLHIMLLGQPEPKSIANKGNVTAKLQSELVSLESEGGAPVAVVAMRLNADALSDLTILKSGKSTPTTISTTPAITFIVTNTNDSGPGSLRQAVINAEANPGADTINFQIGSGPQTITLQSNLPSIADPVTIDASTQPGYAGQPLIQMNGINNTIDFAAFDIYAGSSTVRGFVINRFRSNGLTLLQNPGNIVEGNYIGTDVTGRIALPNDFRGIGIGGDGQNIDASSNNRIGGTTPQARNIISGNRVQGVRILNLNSTGNLVQGNYIGTDVTGTVGLGNNLEGIYIGGGNNNTVGGMQPGAGNVISSNGSSGTPRGTSGVHIGTSPFQTGATGNLVQGNRIGTNVSGTAALGNAREGVVLEDGASSNMIGGTTAAARNIISGNRTNGLDLGFAMPVTLNQVLGNYIGTDVTGNNPLGNDGYGIFINVNSVNNTIRDNRIAFNGAGGIFIPNDTPDPGAPGVRIAIDSNAIFANGGLGIDLGDPGITANDLGDPDGGANLQQNFPVLTSTTSAVTAAVVDGLASHVDSALPTASEAALNVNGTLNSTANSTFTVNWYFSVDSQCSNNQQGSRPLAFGRIPGIATDANGNAPFSFPFEFPPGTSGGVINCTATDPNGNTSEFSSCLQVMAPPTRTLTVASVNPNSGVIITVSGQASGTTQFLRTYDDGTSVMLTAPGTASGNTFQKWQRDGVDWATTPATSLTMDAN